MSTHIYNRALSQAQSAIEASYAYIFLQQKSPYVLAVISLGLVYALLATRSRKLPLPYYYVEGDVVATLTEAHKEHPDGSFALSLPAMDLAVLGRRELDTIKSLPESELSIKQHHYNVFLGEYSYMGTETEEFDNVMRYVLTRNTPVVLKSFTAEIEYAMNKEIGKSKDWAHVTASRAMSHVAAILSGRVFVGLPLSRDPDWIESSATYTQNISRAWIVLRFIPWPLRFFVAPFLPQVRGLLKQKREALERLAPQITAQRNGTAEKSGPGGEMINWLISQYKAHPTIKRLSRDQLLVTFSSIYNLSHALTYIAFDLAAADPKIIHELRQELLEVLGSKGEINRMNITQLRKLDSFARESQRLSPPALVNIPRIVTGSKGLRLSTGEVIPKGTLVMFASHAVNHDDALWPDSSKFDGLRFYKLRQQPGNDLKYQHVTTGHDNLNFGHGLWACPGRFFAAAEIKVVAAYMLMHYDLKLPPGVSREQQQHYGLAILPNHKTQILFKRLDV